MQLIFYFGEVASRAAWDKGCVILTAHVEKCRPPLPPAERPVAWVRLTCALCRYCLPFVCLVSIVTPNFLNKGRCLVEWHLVDVQRISCTRSVQTCFCSTFFFFSGWTEKQSPLTRVCWLLHCLCRSWIWQNFAVSVCCCARPAGSVFLTLWPTFVQQIRP